MSFENETKDSLIQDIITLQNEHLELSQKHHQLVNHKDELRNISDSLKQQIQDRGEKEILSIDNERDFIMQKSVHDEEIIQSSFQTKLDGVFKQKEELQRKLEAESEFIARNLKERHAKIHQRTLELRSKLLTKSNNNSNVNPESQDAANDTTTDECDNNDAKDEILLQKKIQDIRNYLDETTQRISHSHHEIEVLTVKCERYSKILTSWDNQRNAQNSDIPLDMKQTRLRRKSNVTKHPKLIPEV